MSMAAILREYGFVPSIPSPRQVLGTLESPEYQHVPGVPYVPTPETMAGSQPHSEHCVRRAMVRFRDSGNDWATALGAPGMTTAALVAGIRERWPGAEVQVHE